MMTQTDSNQSTNDLESQYYSVTPSKSDAIICEINAQIRKEKAKKICISLLVFSFYAPIIISEFYFAFTDKTCVHNTTKNIIITLYDYLIVTAIYTSLAVSVFIYYGNYCDIERYPMLITMYEIIAYTFGRAWLILGALLFWDGVDTSTCSTTVYNYLNTLLLVQFILQGLYIILQLFVMNKE